MNRGNVSIEAPGHSPSATIADYDRAIALMEDLRASLRDHWPVPWRNDLAEAYTERGKANWLVPALGPVAAIADYQKAIALREDLRAALGADWPPTWHEALARDYFNRALARRQVADGSGACADARRAENLCVELVRQLGEGAWNELAGRITALRQQVCGDGAEAKPKTSWIGRLSGLMRG
jgi:hypothetical protein